MDDYGIVVNNFRAIVSSLGVAVVATLAVLFVMVRFLFGKEK